MTYKHLYLVPLTLIGTLIFGIYNIYKIAKRTYSQFPYEVYKCEMWLRYFFKKYPYDVAKEE